MLSHAGFAVALLNLLLTEADAGQLRLGEHGAGHQFMAGASWLTSEDAVCEGAALIDCHESEFDAVSHIAHRINVGLFGALVGVHWDRCYPPGPP